MPTYEYSCPKCKSREEHDFRMADVDAAAVLCSVCGTAMERQISSSVSFVLKGDGWPGKEIRRRGENDRLRTARRKAKRLKESGAVPWEQQIKEKEAAGLYDGLQREMIKKEIRKMEEGKTDREMSEKITKDQ